MVLGVSAHAPSAGYRQQGYGHNDGNMHKEDYYKTDNYGNSSSMQMMRPHSGVHSPSGPNHHSSGGYPNTNGSGYGISQHGPGSNGYGNSGFTSGITSQHGPGSNGYGNSGFTSGITSQNGPGSNGYGNSGYSSGTHSHHGSGSNGYGNNHSSHIPMGPSRPQDGSYGYQSHIQSSNRPYYQQQPNGSHGWISKDLDD